MNLESFIREVQDFPKPGIGFKDITPLLLNVEAVDYSVKTIAKTLEGVTIDKVVGVESRGFFLGSLLAQQLNAGFVPVRKPNKLPCETISASYELEYGTDTLEMHIDAIQKGDNVVIHDDVLATGGTAKAVCEMVEKLGGKIIQFNFIMELSFLQGKNKLGNRPIFSLLEY